MHDAQELGFTAADAEVGDELVGFRTLARDVDGAVEGKGVTGLARLPTLPSTLLQ